MAATFAAPIVALANLRFPPVLLGGWPLFAAYAPRPGSPQEPQKPRRLPPPSSVALRDSWSPWPDCLELGWTYLLRFLSASAENDSAFFKPPCVHG